MTLTPGTKSLNFPVSGRIQLHFRSRKFPVSLKRKAVFPRPVEEVDKAVGL